MISRWLGDEVAKRRNGGQRVDPEAQTFSLFPEVQNLLQRQGLQLSGGQRKMAIARAMMLSPSLLLDEAIANRFTEAVMKIKAMGVPSWRNEISVRQRASATGFYAIDRGEIIFHGSAEGSARRRESDEGVAPLAARKPARTPCPNVPDGAMARRSLLIAATSIRDHRGPQRPRAAGLSVLLSP